MAIIADPQLTDWMSYHQSGLLLALVEAYTDIYMKRSFRRLHASLRPDAVLFLGDLNDGGRNTDDQTFVRNTGRFFEWIFATKRRSLRLYMAGNHDVGFGDTLIRSSMVRYKRVFGSVNYEVNVGNHSLVVLDTLALSSRVPSIRGESQQFLDHIKQEQPSLPRILFTHVPLHRLDTTSCGKARETDQVILDRGGEQYQNMVDSSLSREILESVQPDMVFSGDDHDWCEIAHSTVGGNLTPEVTLRTFSFAQGIQRPSFGMMTL
ncbi:MAG: Metallo-dependent phosphatase-like protein, partial [Linnemannia elongata]